MGRTCYLCNRTTSKTESISLHSFPKDLTIRQKWLYVCNLNLDDDVSRLYVCSIHFAKEDIIKYNTFGKSAIKSKAIPSKFETNPLVKKEKVDIISKIEVADTTCNPVKLRLLTSNDDNNDDVNNTANDNIYNTPKKQRKFLEPRYISEITTADVETPRKADRVIKFIKTTDEKKSKQIKNLQDETRKLRKRIKSLQDLVSHLKDKKMISEEAGDTFMTTKCGYCGFILHGSCGTILDHHCFSAYDENTDVIIVDENAVATMRKRHETEVVQDTNERESAFTQDELLIELVRTRKALWDHSIPLNQRTKLKKENLWQEIVNVFDGSLSMEAVKQRWKHLRDSYIKARRKMRGYVRSRSGAESGHPLRSFFAHYEEMKFLDDTVKTAPTVSSIQHFLEVNSSHVDENAMQREIDTDHLTCDDSIMDVASTSTASSRRSCSPSETRKKKAKIAQRQAEIETKFLDIIDEASQKKRDVVDSYLDQLGDILRRLSYIRRRNLQKRIMDIAIQEEDMEFMERENP